MRTKNLLLAAAALAAGLASSQAQTTVYSVNVVGYVNKSFQSGYFTLVSAPLGTTTNTLKELIPNPPDNTQVYRWNVGLQDLDPTVPTYIAGSGVWSPNPVIKPGEAFFVVGGGNFTNTFVGTVLQGNTTNSIAGNGNFQAVGSPVPIGSTSLTNILVGYAATDNDQVYQWDVPTQDFNPNVPTYIQAQNKWLPDTSVGVADGFFLVRAGGTVNWVRTFNVQ